MFPPLCINPYMKFFRVLLSSF